jgi:hypothetical protein
MASLEAMRVLIYDVQADRYFQSVENWTSDPALAMDFKGTVKAVTAAFLCRLKEVDVVLDFEESQLKMHLPLRACG